MDVTLSPDLEELRARIARGLEQLRQGEKEPLDIDAIKSKARQLRLGVLRAETGG